MKPAIDDSGRRYSSLSCLHRFQIDTSRIDRSFVNRMLNDTDSNRIVDSIVGLAHSLKMEIIAEGVECPEEVGRPEENGCRLVQAFLFACPVPPDQTVGTLENPLKFQTQEMGWTGTSLYPITAAVIDSIDGSLISPMIFSTLQRRLRA